MRRTSMVAGVLATSLAVVALSARPAPIGPEAADIRAAVTRSLPLLQSSADTWFQKRQGASCHHQGLGLIEVTVARERGFPDEALVRGQLERTLRPGRNWQEKFVTGEVSIEVSINEAIGQSYRAVGVGTAGGTRTQMTDEMYEGTTALMGAVEDGRTDVVDALLRAGADVNKVDGSGHAALAYAAVTIDRGTPEIVDRLLVAGARPGSAVPTGEPDVAALSRRWGTPYMAERLEMKR